MSERQPRLVVQSAPFLRQGVTTPGLMRDVLVALVPVLGMAFVYFGVSALLVTAAATARRGRHGGRASHPAAPARPRCAARSTAAPC